MAEQAPDEFDALMVAARDGCNDALGALLERYRGRLVCSARGSLDSLIQSKMSGSDLVQETFLDAQKDFPRFVGTAEQEFVRWLRALLRHNLLNAVGRFRDSKKRAATKERSIDDSKVSAKFAEQLRSREPSASSRAIGHEEARKLESALESLLSIDREVIRLRIWDELGFAEIGARLGRTEGAVRALFGRAVLRLQKELVGNECVRPQ